MSQRTKQIERKTSVEFFLNKAIFASMAESKWFEEWFDTNYYHILYKNRDEAEAAFFITNLLTYLQLDPSQKLLDLACGKGRHAAMMNNLGHSVIGADLSANSISQAKKLENSSLQFIVHDMRLPIEGQQFGAIFNLFTSFGYFDSSADNERMVQSVAQMLEPNGIFVIDFMNAEKVIAHLVEEEYKEIKGIEFSINRTYDGTFIRKNIQIYDQPKNFQFQEKVQAFRLGDFENLLTSNGFEIIQTFGDFGLGSFDAKTSDRLIIIAKKHK